MWLTYKGSKNIVQVKKVFQNSYILRVFPYLCRPKELNTLFQTFPTRLNKCPVVSEPPVGSN